MSIQYVNGDLLKCTSAEALVNAVNCVGVMGKGIALQFKERWPSNYADYKEACAAGDVAIGRMHFHKLPGKTLPRYIINFPTKNHWRGRSHLLEIAEGLQALGKLVDELKIRSIALPALGCGEGGLAWFNVRPLIESTFGGRSGVDTYVYLQGPAARE